MSNRQIFESPEVEQLEEIFRQAAARRQSVTGLVSKAAEAEKAVEVAEDRFGRTLAEDDGMTLEAAVARRDAFRVRIDGLRAAYGLEATDATRSIGDYAFDETGASDESRQLFIAGFEAKNAAAQALLEPAEEGFTSRFATLFRGTGRTPKKSFAAAESASREGQLFSAVHGLIEGNQMTLARLKNRTAKPSEGLLNLLKSPLPRLSDFQELGHD